MSAFVNQCCLCGCRRKEPLRTLKPALSLTRKSIIQDAMDKAEKVCERQS